MAALTYQREIWEIYSLNRPANRDGVFAILHEGSEACNAPSAVSQKYFFDATLHLTTSANSSHIVGTQELNS